MGMRFRKSIKVAPGVRLSVGRKSASVSVGGKGGRVTKSTTGRTTSSVGIPGSGLSYVASSGGKTKTQARDGVRPSKPAPPAQQFVQPMAAPRVKTPAERRRSNMLWGVLAVIAVVVIIAAML